MSINSYEKLYGRLPEDRESAPIDLLGQTRPEPLVKPVLSPGIPATIDTAKAELQRRQAETHTDRPSWDETFKRQYEALEARSTCPRLRVACIAERDHQVLASGYNGAPRGLPHCDEIGCLEIDGHCLRAVHDAQNLIAQAARIGVSLLGATFRSCYLPCIRCALLLIQTGIAEIVYEEPYQNGGKEALLFLCQANVALRQIA